jgi:hypothetical protein
MVLPTTGRQYTPVIGPEYSDCDEPDVKKRFYWTDIRTNRIDAAAAFQMAAQVADGLNPDIRPTALPGGTGATERKRRRGSDDGAREDEPEGHVNGKAGSAVCDLPHRRQRCRAIRDRNQQQPLGGE